MGHDLRATLRRLWARRLVVGGVLAAQGLVIATTVVLFAVSDQLFFKPLPYPGADRIVYLEAQRKIILEKTQAEQEALSGIVNSDTVLQDGAYIGAGNIVFLEHSEAVRDWGFVYSTVTPEFFALFGQPALGRALHAADLRRSPRAMVISHGIWQRVFGGRLDILEAPIEIPGTSYDPHGLGRQWQVVGIMPLWFEFPAGANVWVAHEGPRLGTAPGLRAVRGLPTFARLAPGVTFDQVSGLLPGITLTPLREYLTPRGAAAFLYLCGAALLVLLSSWLQLAATVAARVAARPRELIIRTALGGTRWHVLRPIVLDAAILASLSIAAGLSLTAPVAGAVTWVMPPELRIASDVWLSPRPLVFGAVLFAVGALVLSVVPGAVAVRLRLAGLGAGSSSARFQPNQKAGRLLLGAQMAASVILVYVAALAWHSARAIADVNLGFDPVRLIAVRLPATIPPSSSTPEDRMLDVTNQQQLSVDAVHAVRGLAGIQAATLASRWPLQRPVRALERVWAAAAPDEPIEARITLVSDDYLEMMGARLLEGRGIQASDARGSVVVVDETMAERLRRSGPVLASEVRTTNQRYRVIGVVRNIVHERPDERREPEVFRNITPGSALLVRLGSDPTGRIGDAILGSLTAIWGPGRAPRTLVSIEDEARRVRLPYVSQQALLGALAAVTLFALTAGVLTTVALVLHQRRVDLGIRYALGAGRGAVRYLVWREIVMVVIAGVAAGLAGGWLAGQVMQQFWYDVAPLDPATTWGVILLLMVIVTAAIEWPVRRFQYVSPFMALKEE